MTEKTLERVTLIIGLLGISAGVAVIAAALAGCSPPTPPPPADTPDVLLYLNEDTWRAEIFESAATIEAVTGQTYGESIEWRPGPGPSYRVTVEREP